eukprot:Gregarina_sp_Poly_1__10502@NODE_76_length_15862_cov_98_864577_g65_i0_p5_GENE_NODE_76_length_15862_cov_98_864577_g65_i0NODE_76_length_15862_cov_98_864577_g65_i0_p5_ORF_typecomplete_len446_score45_65Aminotran_5/PF00266_19/2_1e39_NODE_76_length_15862_cov_98_864577_g65_i01214013477
MSNKVSRSASQDVVDREQRHRVEKLTQECLKFVRLKSTTGQDAPSDMDEAEFEGKRKLLKTAGVKRLVVFLFDSTLHHSSFLLLKEMAADRALKRGDGGLMFQWLTIPLDTATGCIDISYLKRSLAFLSLVRDEFSNDLQLFSVAILAGASNVTGVSLPVAEITIIVHQLGGMVIWDFAAVSGSSRPVVSSAARPLANLDALVMSPHKLLGAPPSPGLLIVKASLLQCCRPALPGGGTVRFVTEQCQNYAYDVEQREEPGTPDIIGSIRAGLAFRILRHLDASALRARETALLDRLCSAWSSHPMIDILGPVCYTSHTNAAISRLDNADEPSRSPWTSHLGFRKGIVSFNIRYGNGTRPLDASTTETHTLRFSDGWTTKSFKNRRSTGGLYLHSSFVCTLLNDIFGIQARAGCACAGPYALTLLGINDDLAKQYMEAVGDGYEVT